MSANISTFGRILPAALLLFPLLTAAPVLAEDTAGAPSGDTTILAQLDGQLRPVTTVSRQGSVRIEGGGGMQLFAVDLAKQALPATAVAFSLERDQHVRLEVLDLDGRLVRTLAHGLWAQGRHQLAWQHDADSGDRLTEGLYVVRLVPEAAGERVALAR
jgi:flagellar hook assembly protein FlgD